MSDQWREIGIEECLRHEAKPNNDSSLLLLDVEVVGFPWLKLAVEHVRARRSSECRTESRNAKQAGAESADRQP